MIFWLCCVILLLRLQPSTSSSHTADEFLGYVDYKKISHQIVRATGADVYEQGLPGYYERRKVLNGLCASVFPDLVVVPKTTNDVAKIVKISRQNNVPLSVRSGGHSYICANIKPKGIQVDLRKMNKVEHTTRYPFNPPGPALLLGPGSTWKRVLDIVPMDRYTMVHGQCTEVGVGGFLVGGGMQALGTTQRLGSGSFNVLQYTVVDAEGNILKVSESNVTVIDPESGHQQQMADSNSLYRSLQFVGSSFGIVTEFHYRIFDGPEMLSISALVYIDDDQDLLRFQNAALDGRYSVTLYTSTRDNGPIANIYLVDNYPSINQKRTHKNSALEFLKGYGMKLLEVPVPGGKMSDSSGHIYNYDTAYRTSKEIKSSGLRPLVSASFMNLTNILSLTKLFFDHPLFGLKNSGSRLPAKSECEFCFFAIRGISADKANALSTPILSQSSFTSFKDVLAVDMGNFQTELTCLYKPKINSRCPKIVKRAKTLMRNSAIRKGERLTQYWQTASCDESKDFRTRYWSKENYEMLLKAKTFWDPNNVFNHCLSVGSTNENCCPSGRACH